MRDLGDGEVLEMKGSAAKPYELKNTGGVYSCTCPAWRNQSVRIEQRTCKHLRKLRGNAAEDARVGTAGGSTPAVRAKPASAVAGAEAEADAGASVLLAERWDGTLDPAGWWMSEKLDGVRAYWDGKAFVSRLGNPFLAPDWFTAGLPATPLDGELWAGRKQFQRAVSIVRRQDRGEAWREISFVVFDAPTLDAPFEERLQQARAVLQAAGLAHVYVHDHQACVGIEALRVELARVEGLGGEGLMLRQPGSRYVCGRSSTLLKVKNFHDAEARVIEHLPGDGRHKGRLGALLVEAVDGTRFSVGTGFSDAERAAPPALGSVITYRYQELSTAGVPRFPSYVGVRDDVRLPPPSAAPPPVATSAPKLAPAAPGKGRRFELSDGTSNKFWEVAVGGTEMTVTFGRIGAAGQSKTKSFASEGAAAAEAKKLIDEKTAKGYQEV
jgi:DNA ligase 1